MIDIVFADIDETLLFDKVVDPRTIELIRKVQENTPFCLASARREKRYQQVRDQIPHNHAIYESGCIIRKDGTIDQEWDHYVSSSRAAMKEAEGVIGYTPEWKRHAFVLKVEAFRIPPDEVERIRSLEIEGVGIRINQGKYIDVYPTIAGKGNAIRYLCDSLGIPIINTAAMGDDDNDREMFGACSHLYAVGNALPEIKELIQSRSGFVSEYERHRGAQDVLERIIHDVQPTA